MRSLRPRVRNAEIADALARVADLLEAQDGHRFRVRAYRAAADTLRGLESPVVEILQSEGTAGLEKLLGIGKSIAALVDEYAHNLRLGIFDRLEGQIAPEDLFTTVPGIGEKLAARIHRELHVETLEALEVAAHDGRLARVPGLGPRRVRSIQDSLAAILAEVKSLNGQGGCVLIDAHGRITTALNSPQMVRAWLIEGEPMHAAIGRDEERGLSAR